MLASAHFNGPYKNNWGGEKNFTIAISANWSGMQLFPRSTSLFRKKTSHLTASWKGNLTGHVTRAPWGVTNLSAGPKKKKSLQCSEFSVSSHAPWNKDTCTRQCALFSPLHPFLLEPSSLIKSISCASAVPRQMTFKQLLLFGGEQMGVRAELV